MPYTNSESTEVFLVEILISSLTLAQINKIDLCSQRTQVRLLENLS